MDKGADVSAVDFGKDTPLEAAFKGAATMDNTQILPVAEYLLSNGAEVTDKLKQYMREDAERIEFMRDRISTDVISEVNEALDKLYRLIDIEPVPRHESYDGKTRIVVNETTWQKQHGELWNLLVPGSGHANTVQGEVIRITGRVTYELLDNGGANWDSDYKKMEKTLLSYVKMGNSMESVKYKELKGIVSKGSKASDDMLSRMTELCVEWVTFNLDPIPIGNVTYRR
ncbi:MAG: hypothetical protein IJ661_11195 [Lachnospiraceae bacterium]|nr:hypothetical protein [Lachnospiraceae bacterium]